MAAKIPTEENPEGEMIKRKYSPITPLKQKGYIKFPIKIYKSDEKSGVVGGAMSQFLSNMQIGDNVTVEGPIGKIEYYGVDSRCLTS